VHKFQHERKLTCSTRKETNMLKPSYASKEEIPEGLQEHYTPKDGIFVLDGFVQRNKVEEFRENNRNLAKEKEELQIQLLKFKDIDPDKYSEAVHRLTEIENERLEKAGEFKLRLAKEQQGYQEKIEAEQNKRLSLQKTLNQKEIAFTAANIVMKHAIPAEGNMKYVMSDIQEISEIDPETNDIFITDGKGGRLKNEDGEVWTLDEYIPKVYIRGSNLFKQSEGGGAIGGSDIPFVTQGQVKIDNISGRDIPGNMISDLASGKIQATD